MINTLSIFVFQYIADKDECQSSPCHSTATCINGDGQFTCVCPHNRKGKTCTQGVYIHFIDE